MDELNDSRNTSWGRAGGRSGFNRDGRLPSTFTNGIAA
jgi:hypothetical protein